MTIKTYRTQFSTYEVDEDNQLVRRVTSSHAPTPSQAPDGNWQPYSGYSRYLDGLIFFWPDSGKATITSPIIKVDDPEAAPAVASDD